VGDSLVSPGRTITETDVVMFAAFTGDWNPVHTDVEFARKSPFGERIAHGMLTLVVGTPLVFRPHWFALLPKSTIAIVGMDKIRFVDAVKIGDTIHVEAKILETKKIPGGKGLLGLRFLIKNQRGETPITGRIKALVGCRPEADPKGGARE